MAAEQDRFNQLLISILSFDNATRIQAEEAYNSVPIATRVTYLLGSIHDAALGDEVRQMGAVLLRRLFAAEFNDFYPQLPPESQAALKSEVLRAVQSEQSDGMRRKVCDVAAEVARNLIDDEGNNGWPEFLVFLFQCANSTTPVLKESALRMFTSVPGVFGNQQANYLDLIKQMLLQSMAEQSGYPVQFQAVRAACSFIMAHEKETAIQKHFADVLPALVQITATSVAMQEDDALVKCIIDLAEAAPRFLRPQLEPLFELCIKVLSNEEFAESWRHLCLEVMVTLAETAPPMVRKVGAKYLPLLVPQVLKMMTDVEDDDDWSFCDEIIEEDNDCNMVVAEAALDRLSCGLGGKTMMPHIEFNIPEMLANPDWKYRHAALMALSAVGEGCHKQMEALLPHIMDPVLQFLSDPHPRVRYAACNAVGQMSTDFAPLFEKKFHEKVVPGLLMVLDDNANPRVQAHAGAALVNFSEDCPKQILTQYLDAIMGKLEAILSAKFTELVEKGTKLVLEQVVTTIASVADTSEEQFVAYYDRLMPCLKYIIQNANTEELKLLRGKAIECVSLVGLAVGPDKFIADASEVMDMLLKTQMTDEADKTSDDDMQTSYLISAWARICRILGKRFEQYLPLVMGPVMKAASMKPEVTLVDNEDMEEVDADHDWQFVNLGEQQNFGIKTAEEEAMDENETVVAIVEPKPPKPPFVKCKDLAEREEILFFERLEDKASACEMLVCYARELKEGFADYTEDVVKLMVPMLKFYFHDGVRTAAAESLPYLLDCGKIKGPAFLHGMWSFICPELLKAMDTEPENDVLIEHIYAMAKCIETLGNGCLAEESMTELIRILDKIMTEHFEHAVARQEKRRDEDYDEMVEEQLVDEDNEDVYLLSKVADVVHALFLSYKEAFFPYFDRLCGHFVKCLAPDMPWTDHQWALCVFDDCIEFGGPACAAYQSLFLGPLLRHVADPAAEVRQAAAYGWGVLGQFGGDAFAAACADAIPELVKVITEPDSRAVENINPTENAISAVTKILKHNSSRINLTEMLPHWLSWLPVWEDDDEAPHVYGYLCDLLEANTPAVLGPNNANVPQLVVIFAEAFRREAVSRENAVYDRMANIVRAIQSNAEMFQVCVTQLTAEQQQAVHAALTAPAPAAAQ